MSKVISKIDKMVFWIFLASIYMSFPLALSKFTKTRAWFSWIPQSPYLFPLNPAVSINQPAGIL